MFFLEAARAASQRNLSLSEDKLQEYNRLRSIANTRVVDERQALNALERDEKTSSRALASLQEAFTELKEKESKLVSEIDDLKEKKQEVCTVASASINHLFNVLFLSLTANTLQ